MFDRAAKRTAIARQQQAFLNSNIRQHNDGLCHSQPRREIRRWESQDLAEAECMLGKACSDEDLCGHTYKEAMSQ